MSNQPSTDDGRGAGVEAWILRMMLMAIAAMLIAAIVGSLDDLKRYIRIQQM